MSNYQTILEEASLLSFEERLRLIEELSLKLPNEISPPLSEEWMEVIHRRSREIDNREVKIESWESLQKRLEAKIETHAEN
ncbi:addiction module protein [Rubinisphaera sp.]|uniref:addiction module protein n=1 Tax=Rubinisphaera sp. TaxID=2024857 RepID=UPI000C0DD573|nr:addiction module protein [Rubinisphaera sp.]MBV10235.1 hypothetical protein [Rubinisphaera sp.]HCS54177.1 hypothetical protein [Planctomycetaceae bacterium]|tara:strand:- start:1185 stop:1427 length:243 start_codon:yes stop_codon:yes gene_type:complete